MEQFNAVQYICRFSVVASFTHHYTRPLLALRSISASTASFENADNSSGVAKPNRATSQTLNQNHGRMHLSDSGRQPQTRRRRNWSKRDVHLDPWSWAPGTARGFTTRGFWWPVSFPLSATYVTGAATGHTSLVKSPCLEGNRGPPPCQVSDCSSNAMLGEWVMFRLLTSNVRTGLRICTANKGPVRWRNLKSCFHCTVHT
jgi:hypothetical protein